MNEPYYESEEYKKAKAEIDYQLALIKARRQVRKAQELKEKARRETFDLLFPEFSGMPIIWIIVAIVCILFSLFTMII